MAEFQGLKKDDKDKLTKAVHAYRNVTGEDLTSVLGSIPVAPESDQDPQKLAQRAEKQLERSAKAQRAAEDADQLRRQADIAAMGGPDEITDDTPAGPGQPATRTERARQAGQPHEGGNRTGSSAHA